MPAFVSHHYFAVSSLLHAQPYISQAAAAAPMAFRWGAQGPDFLYYYRPFYTDNHISRIADTIHEQHTIRLFSCLTAACRRAGTPEAAAYLLGFCCHYALDRTTQPFITDIANSRLDALFPMLSYRTLHDLCESELDRALLERLHPGSSTHYRNDLQLSADASSLLTVSDLLPKAVWDAYGTRLPARAVRSSMRSLLHTQRLLHDTTGRRAAAIGWLENHFRTRNTLSSRIRPVHPLQADCVNRSHRMWMHAGMPHIPQYTDYFELFQQARGFAEQLMEVCYDSMQTGKPLPPQLFRISFNGFPE